MPAGVDVLVWITVLAFAAIILALYTGIRVFQSVGGLRRESKEAAGVARKVREEWLQHERKQTSTLESATRDLDERMTQVEQSTSKRTGELEERVNGLLNHITQLEEYLREFFEVEVKNSFDSFDQTVTNVLDQMRAELLRGVDRIEEIQSVVGSKTAAEDRFLEGKSAVYRLTEGELTGTPAAEEAGQESPAAPEQSAAEADEPQVEAEEPDSAQQTRPGAEEKEGEATTT